MLLGIDPRAWDVLGKSSSTEPHSSRMEASFRGGDMVGWGQEGPWRQFRMLPTGARQGDKNKMVTGKGRGVDLGEVGSWAGVVWDRMRSGEGGEVSSNTAQSPAAL